MVKITTRRDIEHGVISFNKTVTISANKCLDIDTGFKINGEFTDYIFIPQFSGSWAWSTINMFKSVNSTLEVTVLNATSVDVTENNAPFTYNYIKFNY